jgi:GTP cyclohydrolase II
VDRLSADVPISSHSAKYLATKREKMGHLSSLMTLSAEVVPR